MSYTPTDDEIREDYIGSRYDPYDGVRGGYDTIAEEFDRWQAKHDREVGARVLRELASNFTMAANAGVEVELNTTVAKLIRNRANLIEGQGLT